MTKIPAPQGRPGWLRVITRMGVPALSSDQKWAEADIEAETDSIRRSGNGSSERCDNSPRTQPAANW